MLRAADMSSTTHHVSVCVVVSELGDSCDVACCRHVITIPDEKVVITSLSVLRCQSWEVFL